MMEPPTYRHPAEASARRKGMDALWKMNRPKTKTTGWWLHRSPCEATAMVNTSSSSLGKPLIFSPCMSASYDDGEWEMKDLDVDVIPHPGGDQVSALISHMGARLPQRRPISPVIIFSE